MCFILTDWCLAQTSVNPTIKMRLCLLIVGARKLSTWIFLPVLWLLFFKGVTGLQNDSLSSQIYMRWPLQTYGLAATSQHP